MTSNIRKFLLVPFLIVVLLSHGALASRTPKVSFEKILGQTTDAARYLCVSVERDPSLETVSFLLERKGEPFQGKAPVNFALSIPCLFVGLSSQPGCDIFRQGCEYFLFLKQIPGTSEMQIVGNDVGILRISTDRFGNEFAKSSLIKPISPESTEYFQISLDKIENILRP